MRDAGCCRHGACMVPGKTLAALSLASPCRCPSPAAPRHPCPRAGSGSAIRHSARIPPVQAGSPVTCLVDRKTAPGHHSLPPRRAGRAQALCCHALRGADVWDRQVPVEQPLHPPPHFAPPGHSQPLGFMPPAAGAALSREMLSHQISRVEGREGKALLLEEGACRHPGMLAGGWTSQNGNEKPNHQWFLQQILIQGG